MMLADIIAQLGNLKENMTQRNQYLKPSKEDSMARLRQTMSKLQQRSSQFRKSLSPNLNHIDPKDIRMSALNSHVTQKKTDLKSKLDSLEEKVLSFREQLLPQPCMKKKKQLKLQLNQKPIKQENQMLKQGTTDSIVTVKNQGKITGLITSMPKPKNYKPTYINPYSPRRHNIYYVSEAVRAIHQKNSLSIQHISASINMIKACEQQGIPDYSEIEKYKVNLSRNIFYKNKKTLVLDLDETLIHCVGNYEAQADFNLNIKIEEQNLSIGVNIRPHAITFLKKMAQKFQIIIFTASHETYADAILDQLDPEGQIFQHRLYRQHCFVIGRDQIHVKDLRIINRSLSEMILVDNAAYSYAFQLENGIPILPFYYGADYELVALEKYLEQMEKINDVRQMNKKTFKLHHYSKFQNPEELIEELYMNNFQ